MFVLRSISSRNALKVASKSCHTSICPETTVKNPVVTVLDAFDVVGKNIALLLKQNPQITELRVYDDTNDACSIAKDLSHIDTGTKVTAFSPNVLREAITGAHVVVSCGNCQEKPHQSQGELFQKNVDNVRTVSMFLSEFNPKAIYCVAKSPVEALVPMVSEEYKRAEVYDHRKIIGVTTSSSMVANRLVATHLQVDPVDVLCPVVGGFSPKGTVAVLSQTKPPMPQNNNLFNELLDRIANAEEIVLEEHHAAGPILRLSEAVAVSRFVNMVVRALRGDQNCVECAFVRQVEHIEEFLPYMTSIVKLGVNGIASTHMPKINELEIERLRAAVPFILENIMLGQTFASGARAINQQQAGSKTKSKCDYILQQKLEELHAFGVCRR